MGTVAAVGEHMRVRGFVLAGVDVFPAEHAEEVREAWRSLPDQVSLVIVTSAAAEALGPELEDARFLTVVMPR
ncbi:V-type ATP synthase subunit F [Streptomyces sp. NPDC048623]|uniref:V-type ATP synthase subunit F n=1 Tax=Streptomyces sp. NPDC048623 TaxID=3155761 RepID=UPI00342652C4